MDPVDDEMEFKNTFQRAGFGAQQRIRMLLRQPTSTENRVQIGDWHADSRLLCPSTIDLEARGVCV